MASIKAESTVDIVTCMVCGKGGFTEDNPPVCYKGYTDHLQCFVKDFIKKFCKKNDFVYPEELTTVKDTLSLPKLNSAWAALVDIGTEEEPEAVVLFSDYKTKLESNLAEYFELYSGASVLGIFRKGKPIAYKTVMTIRIVEESDASK